MTREEIVTKFRATAGRAVSAEAADRIEQVVGRLDADVTSNGVGDVAELTAACA